MSCIISLTSITFAIFGRIRSLCDESISAGRSISLSSPSSGHGGGRHRAGRGGGGNGRRGHSGAGGNSSGGGHQQISSDEYGTVGMGEAPPAAVHDGLGDATELVSPAATASDHHSVDLL